MDLKGAPDSCIRHGMCMADSVVLGGISNSGKRGGFR